MLLFVRGLVAVLSLVLLALMLLAFGPGWREPVQMVSRGGCGRECACLSEYVPTAASFPSMVTGALALELGAIALVALLVLFRRGLRRTPTGAVPVERLAGSSA